MHTEEIASYNTAVVTIDHFKSKKQIQLLKAVFILGFHTNLVSLKKLNEKGVYWSNEKNILYYGNKVMYAHCGYHCDQSTFKYNEPKEEDLTKASFATQLLIKHLLKPLQNETEGCI